MVALPSGRTTPGSLTGAPPAFLSVVDKRRARGLFVFSKSSMLAICPELGTSSAGAGRTSGALGAGAAAGAGPRPPKDARTAEASILGDEGAEKVLGASWLAIEGSSWVALFFRSLFLFAES